MENLLKALTDTQLWTIHEGIAFLQDDGELQRVQDQQEQEELGLAVLQELKRRHPLKEGEEEYQWVRRLSLYSDEETYICH